MTEQKAAGKKGTEQKAAEPGQQQKKQQNRLKQPKGGRREGQLCEILYFGFAFFS